ncbi:J domain-containing protein [Ancylobacter polymorphus]|uniref:J domain-containing protein n=1 Tax=Ancylobacter polymorphus TaxID=223390 RepID=A0ABU0BE19_9HYPH|nr:J domain-containing protein [Ancylobacter polymorphus]MDQ0303844.1 hypothetical protein [Ancylobacter polymorphus]
MVEAYPLQWPNRPRKATRRRATFGTVKGYGKAPLTVAEAVERLSGELARLGARYVVISSNVELRRDGLPRSGQKEPADPGVAVYFQLAGKPHCLPCDTFDRVADNMAAIAGHIKAVRAQEAYGVATIAESFAGFVALPPPGAARPWREVMGFSPIHRPGSQEIAERYRRLARDKHPDAGGSQEAMAELNAARDAAMKEGG